MNVQVVSYTAWSVYLHWTPGYNGNSDILGYNLYMNEADSGSYKLVDVGVSSVYTTNGTSLNITSGILPYTRYQFRVTACNALGCSNITAGAPSTPITTKPTGMLYTT